MFSTSAKNIFSQFIIKNNCSVRVDKNFLRLISTSDGVKNSDILLTNKNKQQQNDEFIRNSKRLYTLKNTSRTLSTLNSSIPLAVNTMAVSKEESRQFMSVFPDLVRDLTEKTKKYEANDAAKWLARALQYNVPLGKKNRGLAVILSYKALADQKDLTPENIKLVKYLGWCVEMMQSSFLIADDIMDDSATRRGQPCWHRLDDVKLDAINDGTMIQIAIYYILKKYFEDKPYYIKLVETFNDTIFTTTIGQSMDLRTATKDVLSFTMDRYKTIVAHKTAYYTFYAPVALAMHMAGYNDLEIFRQTKTILLEMGHFFQVTDDFIDCFGDPKVTGKIGTDIENNKCTWLSVVCMQRANNEQKAIMKECYGKSDPEKVMRVKKLYEELGLPHTYHLYEEESYNLIKTHIQQTSRGVPHNIFFKILEKIYRNRGNGN